MVVHEVLDFWASGLAAFGERAGFRPRASWDIEMLLERDEAGR
jgi:hypothetical protein